MFIHMEWNLHLAQHMHHVHNACACMCLCMSCMRRGAHGVSPLGTAGLAAGCSQGGLLCTYSARTLHALRVRPTGATRDAAALRAAVAGVGLLRSRVAALSSVLRTSPGGCVRAAALVRVHADSPRWSVVLVESPKGVMCYLEYTCGCPPRAPRSGLRPPSADGSLFF